MMQPETLALIVKGNAKKGDVLGAARHRRHHGGQAHLRADPALPSAGAVARSRSTSHPMRKLPGMPRRARR